VGFWLWAGKVSQLDLGSRVSFIILAGAGMGLMLGPAQTDAVNRASRFAYGEATGITQTIRGAQEETQPSSDDQPTAVDAALVPPLAAPLVPLS
jgi:hypothetical protein